MILKTKTFQEAAKTILMAVDNNAANIELVVKENYLYLNVTNREYYVSIRQELEQPETFKAVVDASLFLSLIAGISTEEFELKIKDNTVIVKSGKSSYKLPMIYENDKLMELPVIALDNVTVEMPISLDILQSILNVNSKELLKVKNIDVNELQKLYYVTDEGCFTFTSGSCLNSFKLDKPIKMLLNDRIVKLFKLFKEDVEFKFGYDEYNGYAQTKISLVGGNVHLSAIITNDDILLSKVQNPCAATKNFINENYPIKLVLSVQELSSAISRLLLFTKNSVAKANMLYVPVDVKITADEIIFVDKAGNSEAVVNENGSFVEKDYDMTMNISDLKLVLDSCKDKHITFNCGNGRSIVVTRGPISNLLPESRRD